MEMDGASKSQLAKSQLGIDFSKSQMGGGSTGGGAAMDTSEGENERLRASQVSPRDERRVSEAGDEVRDKAGDEAGNEESGVPDGGPEVAQEAGGGQGAFGEAFPLRMVSIGGVNR